MLKNIAKRGRRFFPQVIAAGIRFLRPLLGPAQCKFAIGCTQFAIHTLKTERFLYACALICKRLLLCSPFGSLQQLISKLTQLTTLTYLKIYGCKK